MLARLAALLFALLSLCAAAAAFRFVFLLNRGDTAALGGLAGADELCRAAAASSSVSPLQIRAERFVAWLSDSQTDARDRIGNLIADDAYRLPDGVTVVASGRGDLLDGSLAHAIEQTADAQTCGVGAACGSSFVFSGTHWNGLKYDQFGAYAYCDNWINSTAVKLVSVGRRTMSDESWSKAGAVSCSYTTGLFCFEGNPPPTPSPSRVPTAAPTEFPTLYPSAAPSPQPTRPPSASPTPQPSAAPSAAPTEAPTTSPLPTASPSTSTSTTSTTSTPPTTTAAANTGTTARGMTVEASSSDADSALPMPLWAMVVVGVALLNLCLAVVGCLLWRRCARSGRSGGGGSAPPPRPLVAKSSVSSFGLSRGSRQQQGSRRSRHVTGTDGNGVGVGGSGGGGGGGAWRRSRGASNAVQLRGYLQSPFQESRHAYPPPPSPLASTVTATVSSASTMSSDGARYVALPAPIANVGQRGGGGSAWQQAPTAYQGMPAAPRPHQYAVDTLRAGGSDNRVDHYTRPVPHAARRQPAQRPLPSPPPKPTHPFQRGGDYGVLPMQ